ncbi:MAG: hypothetical protein Q8R00_03545 [Candidatus Nanoarchaeia archaeon]|nr:hypothetical protein [Candidatus Nanoarchaeia archaeon]
MENKPYIGITGFKIEKEVECVSELFKRNLKDTNYTAMFGFVTSTKRLMDWRVGGKTSPAVKEITHLINLVHREFLPVLHHYMAKPERLYDEICQLHFAVPVDWGLQINSAWPEVNEVYKIKNHFNDKKIILQMPKQAIESGDYHQNLRKYSGLVDYVLIDPSGGKGLDFDLVKCSELMQVISEALPEAIVGIAGGLSGDNVAARFDEIAKAYEKPFSIDAEGKLRVETFSESFLDFEEVKSYIEKSAKAIKDTTFN